MTDEMRFLIAAQGGLGALHLLVTAAAALLFWPCRRISPGMNLVLAGLIGMVLAGTVGRFALMSLPEGPWSNPAVLILPSLVELISWGMMVVGLAITFRDVRRAVSLFKDRRHDPE